jgi:hypothetical protein
MSIQLERLGFEDLAGDLLTCEKFGANGKCLRFIQTCDGEDCITESPAHPTVPGREEKKRKRKPAKPVQKTTKTTTKREPSRKTPAAGVKKTSLPGLVVVKKSLRDTIEEVVNNPQDFPGVRYIHYKSPRTTWVDETKARELQKYVKIDHQKGMIEDVDPQRKDKVLTYSISEVKPVKIPKGKAPKLGRPTDEDIFREGFMSYPEMTSAGRVLQGMRALAIEGGADVTYKEIHDLFALTIGHISAGTLKTGKDLREHDVSAASMKQKFLNYIGTHVKEFERTHDQATPLQIMEFGRETKKRVRILRAIAPEHKITKQASDLVAQITADTPAMEAELKRKSDKAIEEAKAILKTKEKHKELTDEEIFNKGVTGAQRQYGDKTREYDRVLGGMVQLLKSKGHKIQAGDLANAFHEPLALIQIAGGEPAAGITKAMLATYERDLRDIADDSLIKELPRYSSGTRHGWALEKLRGALRATAPDLIQKSTQSMAESDVKRLAEKPRKGTARFAVAYERMLPQAKLKVLERLGKEIADQNKTAQKHYENYVKKDLERARNFAERLEQQGKIIHALLPESKEGKEGLQLAESIRDSIDNITFDYKNEFETAAKKAGEYTERTKGPDPDLKTPKRDPKDWEQENPPKLLNAPGLNLKKGEHEYIVSVRSHRPASEKGTDYEVVAGKPITVKNAEFLDLFMHRMIGSPGTWAITEVTTGLAFAQGKEGSKQTQDQVHKMAEEKAEKSFTTGTFKKDFQKNMQDMRKINEYPHLESTWINLYMKQPGSGTVSGIFGGLAGDLLTCDEWQIVGEPGAEHIKCKSYKRTCKPGDADCAPRGETPIVKTVPKTTVITTPSAVVNRQADLGEFWFTIPKGGTKPRRIPDTVKGAEFEDHLTAKAKNKGRTIRILAFGWEAAEEKLNKQLAEGLRLRKKFGGKPAKDLRWNTIEKGLGFYFVGVDAEEAKDPAYSTFTSPYDTIYQRLERLPAPKRSGIELTEEQKKEIQETRKKAKEEPEAVPPWLSDKPFTKEDEEIVSRFDWKGGDLNADWRRSIVDRENRIRERMDEVGLVSVPPAMKDALFEWRRQFYLHLKEIGEKKHHERFKRIHDADLKFTRALDMLKAPKKQKGEIPEAVKIKVPADRMKASPHELAAHYRASGLNKWEAWDQFIKDRALKPEMDAKEFYDIYGSVTAHLLQETKTVGFEPTHIDSKGRYYQIDKENGVYRFVSDTGNSGSNPEQFHKEWMESMGIKPLVKAEPTEPPPRRKPVYELTETEYIEQKRGRYKNQPESLVKSWKKDYAAEIEAAAQTVSFSLRVLESLSPELRKHVIKFNARAEKIWDAREVKRIMAEPEPMKAPTPTKPKGEPGGEPVDVWMKDNPFTKDDNSKYNAFRMSWSGDRDINEEFHTSIKNKIDLARERMDQYGIEETPEEIKTAIWWLRRRAYEYYQRMIYSGLNAPGSFVVGPSKYNVKKHNKVIAGDQKYWDKLEQSRNKFDIALKKMGEGKRSKTEISDLERLAPEAVVRKRKKFGEWWLDHIIELEEAKPVSEQNRHIMSYKDPKSTFRSTVRKHGREVHKNIIKFAFEEGLEVDPAVLAEYPDLARPQIDVVETDKAAWSHSPWLKWEREKAPIIRNPEEGMKIPEVQRYLVQDRSERKSTEKGFDFSFVEGTRVKFKGLESMPLIIHKSTKTPLTLDISYVPTGHVVASQYNPLQSKDRPINTIREWVEQDGADETAKMIEGAANRRGILKRRFIHDYPHLTKLNFDLTAGKVGKEQEYIDADSPDQRKVFTGGDLKGVTLPNVLLAAYAGAKLFAV